MGQDGVKNGYDIELLKSLGSICSIPMIASGGAGEPQHFINAFKQTNVDGALAASIFHRNEYSINQVKKELQANNINIRI
jgi:cyclase